MCWGSQAVYEVKPHQFADGSEEMRPREYRIPEEVLRKIEEGRPR